MCITCKANSVRATTVHCLPFPVLISIFSAFNLRSAWDLQPIIRILCALLFDFLFVIHILCGHIWHNLFAAVEIL